MTAQAVAAGGPLFLILGAVVLLDFARRAWKRHVNREPRSVQEMFDRLEAEQRADRTRRCDRG